MNCTVVVVVAVQVENVSQSVEGVHLRTYRDLRHFRESEPLLRGVDGRLHSYASSPRTLTSKGLQVRARACTRDRQLGREHIDFMRGVGGGPRVACGCCRRADTCIAALSKRLRALHGRKKNDTNPKGRKGKLYY